MYLSDFFSNFKLFSCLDFPFLYIFTKIFKTYLLLLPCFSLYRKKCSSIINHFFYRHIFYGSGSLNGETFFSLKGSYLIKKCNKYYNFLNPNLGCKFIPVLVSFTYSEFVKSILNISSFLTLPHLLDCFICTRNSVSLEFF